MRQIVSLIKDNQVHYALVDDDSGELIPFADVLLPDPDRFGLHEAAVLGTNLINTLGLNGRRPRKVAEVIAAETPALPAAPTETRLERRRRLDRERKATRLKDTSKGGAERYITMDEVLAVVNQYPEGITTAQIAERIWRQDGNEGTVPSWVKMAIGNRQTTTEVALKARGTPLPYRIEYRAKIGKSGLPTNIQTKYLLPLADRSPARGGPNA